MPFRTVCGTATLHSDWLHPDCGDEQVSAEKLSGTKKTTGSGRNWTRFPRVRLVRLPSFFEKKPLGYFPLNVEI